MISLRRRRVAPTSGFCRQAQQERSGSSLLGDRGAGDFCFFQEVSGDEMDLFAAGRAIWQARCFWPWR